MERWVINLHPRKVSHLVATVADMVAAVEAEDLKKSKEHACIDVINVLHSKRRAPSLNSGVTVENVVASKMLSVLPRKSAMTIPRSLATNV